MKCHEKLILLLIWLKEVGHRDGDAQSSWQRWPRSVPSWLCRAGAATAVGPRGWGKVGRPCGALPHTIALQSIV